MSKQKQASKQVQQPQAAVKTFQIISARGYFDELVTKSFQDYLSNLESHRHGLACAIFTWHMVDWLVNQQPESLVAKGLSDLPTLRAHICSECPSFHIVDEIANGSKHMLIRKAGVEATKLQPGFLRGPLLAWGTVSQFTITYQGKHYLLVSVLKQCVEYWDKFLTDHGL